MSNIQAGYDRWSTVYDSDANPLPPLEEPWMQAGAGNVAGLRVLDAGCGTGRHCIWMAQAGARVSAMDFSVGMLEKAQQKPGAEGIEFTVHDLHQPWPYVDSTFDLVVSGLVLEHITTLEPFFAEVRRVLRPGGRALLSTLHPAMFLRGSQARFTDPITGEIIQPGSIPHSMSQLILTALQARFRLETLHEISPDASFAAQFPRAEKYIGWPMLLVMELTRTLN